MKRTNKGSVGSHVAYSLAASVLGVAVTLATLPYIVSQLGLANYGLLSLLAVASAYVGILDFGFSWTSSRFVAEALEQRNDAMLESVLRASLVLYVVVGLVGGGAIALAAAPLVDHVFNVPRDARGAGIEAARLIALGFPFAMLQVFGVAALRGARRFDLTALLQVAGTVGTSSAMVVALAASGGGLVVATAALAGSQVGVAVFGLAATWWVLPRSFTPGRVEGGVLRALMRFSTRVAVANVGSQLLYLPNRLAVGVLLPLGAVGLFSVPLALAQRLQVVPTAVVSAALPTMTAAAARRAGDAYWGTFWQLTGIISAVLLPLCALAFIWAPTLLQVWFSRAFTEDAAWVLRIALVAILLNAISAMLAVACDSAGAPGVSAVGSVIAGVVNVPLAFGLTAAYGIVGSAVALAASLALLGVVIAALMGRAELPQLQLPSVRRIKRPKAGVAAAFACTWVVATAAIEREVDSRMSLVTLGILVLAVAYCGLALMVGPRRLVAWTSQRSVTSGV